MPRYGRLPQLVEPGFRELPRFLLFMREALPAGPVRGLSRSARVQDDGGRRNFPPPVVSLANRDPWAMGGDRRGSA